MYQSIVSMKAKKLLVAVMALALGGVLALAGCAADDSATSEPAASTAASSQDSAAAGDEAAGDMVVSVSVTMPEGADASSEVAEVTVPQGATVYDALMATGWDVQSESSEYGAYVTSINGVANGSEGEASGWVFTVSDQQVMEGCDTHKLDEGDSVQWSFYVG